jgi:hypothetical protein
VTQDEEHFVLKITNAGEVYYLAGIDTVEAEQSFGLDCEVQIGVWTPVKKET